MIELPPQYDSKSVEPGIYKKWLEAGAFHAVATPDCSTKDSHPFSMVIPPPNVTGALHLGHAINGTIQDILARHHRMKGQPTLWMPGIDHAGIATQAVVEKTIFEKEKKNRHDLGREELVRRIWEWKQKFGDRILMQLQSMGTSCDWDRARFTLDETCAKAVREAFFKMFKDGLIFRGKRLVNWDTHLQTAVADDEIYHETVRGEMTEIKYPVENDPTQHSALSTQYLIVATTRPETMLGDTAVAVHPDDPRYTHLHGKFVIVPLVGRRIPIITDGLLVDPKFGTGVVKVTPAHDPNDYATGQRHKLEMINLLTPEGRVNDNGQGEFNGITYTYVGLKFATEARKRVLADLEGLGLIGTRKPHEHEVGHSDRSKTPIEPYLSDQWFVRMGDIAESTPTEQSKTEPQSERQSEPRPLGSGASASAEVMRQPHSNALAYFITFHTYATWVRGQEPGAVDDEHNTYGTPFVPPDNQLRDRELANATEPPFQLSLEQRTSVLNTILEVAAHRGWQIHAVNVRTTHVHLVVGGKDDPNRMMNDFKAYATRRMREADLIAADTKVWSRHGSTPHLWKNPDLAGAVHYTLDEQGDNTPGTFFHGPTSEQRASEPRPLGSGPAEAPAEVPTKPLPHGRGSDGGVVLANGQRVSGLAQAAMDAVTDGRVKITPERYAKGYLDWLGQKRDWCISRQLWWGHRIPVWTKASALEYNRQPNGMVDIDTAREAFDLDLHLRPEFKSQIVYQRRVDQQTGTTYSYACIRQDNKELVAILESAGFTQDPDVLDTWFSSALWPISTMGWPQSEPRPLGSGPAEAPAEVTPKPTPSAGMLPEPGLIDCFYPTSVLSTAREILTLWVARMVMFGLYCKGDVPFRDVYIHAVIQDGEGRPMKKSLGNGVDPVEIVASYGADALRFTLASMATETQDIRLPVVKDPKTGINTSPKFELGRNFANKIWNASRFILGNLSDDAGAGDGNPRLSDQLTALEDRWILSRLHATIQATEAAINTYRFADLATALYQFFWTDLCDWYLEIAKGRIKSGDATVQAILLECLRTSLKLLHPVMPFVTEEIWGRLGNKEMLIVAPWPKYDESRRDASAEREIGVVQELTRAIREVRNEHGVALSKILDVTIRVPNKDLATLIEANRGIVERMANAQLIAVSDTAVKPTDAATAVLAEAEVYVAGVVDKDAERKKLTKRKEDLGKFIAGNKAKLGNEAFVGKAPPKVVQGLRDQLAQQEAELAAVEKNLAEL